VQSPKRGSQDRLLGFVIPLPSTYNVLRFGRSRETFLGTYQHGGCSKMNRHGIPLRLVWPLEGLRFIQKSAIPPAKGL
jgi:hypothetical protein